MFFARFSGISAGRLEQEQERETSNNDWLEQRKLDVGTIQLKDSDCIDKKLTHLGSGWA